ncbi:TPA: hypothetical protein EYO57_12360 [Candidatus Poribacteria bacterium]|nr:hypothetical protein [Candidatus Poribacteria bacterium]
MRVHYIHKSGFSEIPYNLREILGDGFTYSDETHGAYLEDVEVVILSDDMDESMAMGKPYGRYLTGDNKKLVGKIDPEISASPPHRYESPIISYRILPLPISSIEEPSEKERVVLYSPLSSDNGILNELVDVGNDPAHGFRVVYIENSGYPKSRDNRIRSMIYVGDCIYGVIGHGELEALQCGCCVLSAVDSMDIMNLKRINPELHGEFPVVGCNWMDISDTISTLVENPDYLNYMADRSRSWMLKNYSELWQRKKWTSWILYLRSKNSRSSRR